MKNYEDMSYFEINCKVALYLGESVSREHECMKSGSCFLLTEIMADRVEFNPCNNPSDAWPIIVENKINIEWRDSLKVPPLAKGTGGNQCWHADKNPLRAAMICFLKMNDEREL